MIRIIALVGLVSLSTVAFAQQSSFVPLTVTEQDATNLRKFLDEQPLKFSLPILQWVDALEQRAVKAEADKEKKDDPAK